LNVIFEEVVLSEQGLSEVYMLVELYMLLMILPNCDNNLDCSFIM